MSVLRIVRCQHRYELEHWRISYRLSSLHLRLCSRFAALASNNWSRLFWLKGKLVISIFLNKKKNICIEKRIKLTAQTHISGSEPTRKKLFWSTGVLITTFSSIYGCVRFPSLLFSMFFLPLFHLVDNVSRGPCAANKDWTIYFYKDTSVSNHSISPCLEPRGRHARAAIFDWNISPSE